ncbi:MAG: hypothetical protein JKY51_12110 [Opitutaceae bacterium]|nr:hypothetical protein [Opitutaceae bacterium]
MPDVLESEYIKTHLDPVSVDYYLCGPPMMIEAASNMLKK